MFLTILFAAKLLDNLCNTGKMILIQKGKWLFAGISVFAADILHFWITKYIVSSNSILSILVVAFAGSVGCMSACILGEKLSKERLYVNVILSDDREKMKAFRDFLAEKHIRNVCCDSYTMDWNRKSIAVTAYAETKLQSRLIENYILQNDLKCRRLIQKA